jgi:hypothetical protein
LGSWGAESCGRVAGLLQADSKRVIISSAAVSFMGLFNKADQSFFKDMVYYSKGGGFYTGRVFERR